MTDINGLTATGLITLVVTPNIPPIPPVAVLDKALLVGGTTSATIDVLANDLDPANLGLKVSAVGVAMTVPMDMGVMVTTDQKKVQLTIPAGYVGIITLTYTATDVNGTSSTAAVVVTVQPAALPPAPPVTVPDLFTTMQDSPAALINVISNDVDSAGGGLELIDIAVMNSTPMATHMLSRESNQVRFAPSAGFVGTITVTYTVRDTNMTTATGTLQIIVTAKLPALPPVTVLDTAIVSSSAGAAIIGVVSNDVDTNGGGLTLKTATITAASIPGAGTVTVSTADNAVRYVPATAYTGQVTVTYTITDSQSQTATGVLTITVTP